MGKSSKRIKKNYDPSNSLIPRIGTKLSDDSARISWRFNNADRDGKWRCSLSLFCEKGVKDVVRKLYAFDGMTWSDLKGKNHHDIPIHKISREAQKRLVEIKKDDSDNLFSLRLSNKERLWGIREGNVFSVLWWDPEHTVYPCEKKNT
jgi:hypothetical protein